MSSVIRAVIFDLDGTLVQTEELKAMSYARAAEELRPDLPEQQVIDAYDDMVGRSRDEVAAGLIARFNLEAPAAARMKELSAETPAKAYIALRLRLYEAMIADRALVKKQEYPYSTALLRRVKREGFPIGLATMSYMEQAQKVLDILDVRSLLDVVVTRDMVSKPKPDPEIYLTTAARLHAAPSTCLVIEDSLPGVQSAIAAGMTCVAVSNPLTKDSLHGSRLLPGERLVDDPKTLESVVLPLLSERASALA